jgi:hypothetical protein
VLGGPSALGTDTGVACQQRESNADGGSAAEEFPKSFRHRQE